MMYLHAPFKICNTINIAGSGNRNMTTSDSLAVTYTSIGKGSATPDYTGAALLHFIALIITTFLPANVRMSGWTPAALHPTPHTQIHTYKLPRQ